jgi:hypothetical protein
VIASAASEWTERVHVSLGFVSSTRFATPSDRACLLVRAAVTAGPAARAAWDEWFSGVVLDDVPYEEARLLPQVFANLSASGHVTCLPPRVRGQYRWVWVSNQLRCRTVAPALRSLRDAAIRTVLLKGAALLASGRCAWGAREMGDVDVLVPADRAAEAASVLDAAGWVAMSGVTPDFIARRLVMRRHSWNYETDAPYGQLDLHWHVFEGRGADVDAALWDRVQSVRFGDVALLRLDDADQLVYTIEHASHGEPAHQLVWLVDVARELDRIDPAVVALRARALGVRDLVSDALAVVAATLDTPSAKAAAAHVAATRATRRERVLASTETGRVLGRGSRWLSKYLRAALVQGIDSRHPVHGVGAVLRRRVEPSLCARPVLSAGLALLGRPRRAEVAAMRWLGPFARPPTPGTLAPDEWVDLTTVKGLDRVAGPGWSWPMPDGVWTDGAEARLALDIAIPRGRPLALEVAFGDHAHLSPNPRVVVLLNGRPVIQWTFGAGSEHVPSRVPIPAWLADWCRPVDVAFRVLPPFAPRPPFGRGDVTRAVQLRAVRVIEADVSGTDAQLQAAAPTSVAKEPPDLGGPMMRQVFVFQKVAVLVGPWHEPADPPERGARVEVRLLADEPRRGSWSAAQRIVVDQPVFRADLFDRGDGPPGNLRSAHSHPHFDGVEPCDRHWSNEIRDDPTGWLAAELSDLRRLLARAGVDVDEAPWLDDDAAALRDAVPRVTAAVEAAWESARRE